MNGGRFDFDDGGTYCGGWEDGKAHGHGVCTGPKGQGEYSGAWHYGFEVSGIYTWPSGNSYEGQWQNGKRHGLGAERRGRWVYRGEWTQGYKGRYGVRQSTNSQAKYEGTWANGLQDGYGTETYADGGTYQGQWLRGMRHGYGARRSAPYGVAAKYRSRSHAHASLTSLRSDQGDENVNTTGNDTREKKPPDDSRGGFVLRARSEPPSRRRSLSERSVAVKRTILQGLRIKKQRSTGDINQRVASGTGETPRSIRSSGSTASCASDESALTGYSGHDHGSFIGAEEFVDPNATETYMGEWKNDKRSGFGISERSDGLKYEGEWFNNKKYGYGVTTFKDGTKEEGKYKNNILVTSQRKKNLLFVRSSKLRERIDAAVSAAARAAQIAVQKADIAISRSSTARDRAEQADLAALQAREDSDIARLCAKQFAPDFHQPGTELLKKRQQADQLMGNHVGAIKPTTLQTTGGGQRTMSLFIPKHASSNYVGAENANVTTPPMFTPPEEHQHQAQAQRQHLLMKQHAVSAAQSFEHDPSAADVLLHNDSSVIANVHTDPYGRILDDAHNATPMQTANAPGGGRQVAPVSVQQQQQQQHLRQIQRPSQQQMHQHQLADAHLQQADVPMDYYLPSSSSSAYQQQSHHHQLQHQQQQQQHYQHDPGAGRGGQQQTARFRNVNYQPGAAADSPAISRTPSQSSSRYSINQIMNDHFDQYSMAANPAAAKLIHANLARQQQPSSSTHRQQQSPYSPSDASGSASAALTRRSTLASSRDWKNMPNFDPSKAGALLHEAAGANGASAGVDASPTLGGFYGESESIWRPTNSKLFGQMSGESRGSMPDITELEKTPVQMSREEIARMSSHRRQELQRMQEEAELLRSNPFRYLRYLYHPSVRAWIIRWKLPLLVLFVNFGLSLMFYRLLTYSKENDGGNGEADGQ